MEMSRILKYLCRAVAMSGSALAWWASLKRPLERANKVNINKHYNYNYWYSEIKTMPSSDE